MGTRTLALALIATAAAATASPAAAQIVGRPDYGSVARPSPFLPDSSTPRPPIGREVRGLREDIDRRYESGQISRRQARALKREAAWIATLARRYGRDGLSASERRELETRTQALRAGLNR